jgi:hypothetical protein
MAGGTPPSCGWSRFAAEPKPRRWAPQRVSRRPRRRRQNASNVSGRSPAVVRHCQTAKSAHYVGSPGLLAVLPGDEHAGQRPGPPEAEQALPGGDQQANGDDQPTG